MLKSQGGRAQRAVDGGSSSQEQLCTWRNDLHCSTGLTRESETAVPTKSAEFVRRFLLAIHHSSAKSFFAKAQLPLRFSYFMILIDVGICILRQGTLLNPIELPSATHSPHPITLLLPRLPGIPTTHTVLHPASTPRSNHQAPAPASASAYLFCAVCAKHRSIMRTDASTWT
jgi:hypothetical protein